VKKWPSYLILGIGIALILASFVIYGLRVSQTVIPAGSTPQEVDRLVQKYGLDRPLVEQYGWFLFTFLPGLTLLGIFATVGSPRRDFQHWLFAKVFIVLLLVTNTVSILNYIVTAHASLQDSQQAFWMALVVAVLGLFDFILLLVIWNGFRWSVWVYAINTFILCTLKFVGQAPIFPLLFELSAAGILIFLVRPSWNEMD
jgi:hypothetical protein